LIEVDITSSNAFTSENKADYRTQAAYETLLGQPLIRKSKEIPGRIFLKRDPIAPTKIDISFKHIKEMVNRRRFSKL